MMSTHNTQTRLILLNIFKTGISNTVCDTYSILIVYIRYSLSVLTVSILLVLYKYYLYLVYIKYYI